MIARLSGILAELTADGAVIDVGGVGYLVQCSGRTLDAIGPIGGEVKLLTELQVREDAWTLFGFGSAAEPKPNKVHASSRTCSSVSNFTSPPTGPIASSVRPLHWTR